MPCYQSTNLPGGVTTTGRTSYTTEADCLNACREGACCEGTTCTVKPQCQCQGAGKLFQGVGTKCNPNNTIGRCCFYNRGKASSGYYQGEPCTTQSYCESQGGTWINQCNCSCTTDCVTGINCACNECGTTAPNPLP